MNPHRDFVVSFAKLVETGKSLSLGGIPPSNQSKPPTDAPGALIPPRMMNVSSAGLPHLRFKGIKPEHESNVVHWQDVALPGIGLTRAHSRMIDPLGLALAIERRVHSGSHVRDQQVPVEKSIDLPGQVQRVVNHVRVIDV